MKIVLIFFCSLVSLVSVAQLQAPKQPDTLIVYQVVQKMPSYPGGEDALRKFIQNNIKYPEADRQNKVEGRVVLGLVVERDGSVSNVAVKKGLSTAIDEEAVRIIRLLKFTPGTQNGTTVRVAFVIPVYFKL